MVTNIPVNVKKLKDNATIPTYGSANAAGADLYACISDALTIQPGDTFLVPTGLAMELPEGYAGLIYARSGLASKKDLLLPIRLVLLILTIVVKSWLPFTTTAKMQPQSNQTKESLSW